MASSGDNMTAADAKRLEVALEALRILMIGDDPFHKLINAHRSKEDQPADWTKGFDKLTQQQETYQFKEPADRLEAGATFGVQAPAKRPGDPIPKDERETSSVPAFNKPIPVVIVGPKPLMVKLIDEPIVPGKEPGNTPRGKGPQLGDHSRGREGGGNGLGVIAGMLTKQFAIVFGPLIAFGTILSQTNSGMGVFGKAVNLLGATMAPLVMPFFLMFAAGLMTLSGFIWTKLLPALGGFYKWLLKSGIPLAEEAIGKASDAIDTGIAAKNLVTNGEVPKEKESLRILELIARNVDPTMTTAMFLDHVYNPFKDGEKKESEKARGMNEGTMGQAGPSLGVSGPGVSEPKFDIHNEFMGNLQKATQSLQLAIGPKASYAGLGQVGKDAQLAALNADPIDAQMLKIMQQGLEVWQLQLAAMEKEPPPERTNDRAAPSYVDRGAGGIGVRIGSWLRGS